jgi:hypothetical protein
VRGVRIGSLAPFRSATAALADFLWGRSAWPRSPHSLKRCADLAANAEPRDEGIRVTASLVVGWGGKRCPAVAGRCLEHNEASRSAASSRRMISAVQRELFTKRRRFCPATTAADAVPSPLFISLPEGHLRHAHKDASARDDRTQHRYLTHPFSDSPSDQTDASGGTTSLSRVMF